MARLLDGIRVLDLSTYVAGPTATSMLAEQGAEIVRIEQPIYGDPVRSYAPFFGGVSMSAITNCAGKKSVEIDLRDPAGIELIKTMVPDFDVFVETSKPGTMAKIGLDYETIKAIKPDIIYCSISTFGQTGPWAPRPGFDLIGQALTGLIANNGEPDEAPVRMGPFIVDSLGGIFAFGAICAALSSKARTGEGRFLDVSLYESAAAVAPPFAEYYDMIGIKLSRSGNHSNSSAPYGVYKCPDGAYVAITAASDPLWAALCGLMGRPELSTDARYAIVPARIQNRMEIVGIVQAWLDTLSGVDEAVDKMVAAGVPAAKVKEVWEMLDCPQLQAREYWQRRKLPDRVIESTGRQDVVYRSPAFIASGEGKLDLEPVHEVGQDNAEILSRYLPSEDMEQLLAKWHKK